MKKILCSIAVMLLLVGCGGSSSGEVTKTCTMSSAPIKIVAVAPGEKEDVTTVTMSVDATFEDLGISKDDLTDELKEYMKSTMESTILSSIGISGDSGFEIITNDFTDDGYKLEVKIDVATLADALGGSNEDLSMDSFVEAMQSSGFTCE